MAVCGITFSRHSFALFRLPVWAGSARSEAPDQGENHKRSRVLSAFSRQAGRSIVPAPSPWDFFGSHTMLADRRSSRLTPDTVPRPFPGDARTPYRLLVDRARQSERFIPRFLGRDRGEPWAKYQTRMVALEPKRPYNGWAFAQRSCNDRLRLWGNFTKNPRAFFMPETVAVRKWVFPIELGTSIDFSYGVFQPCNLPRQAMRYGS